MRAGVGAENNPLVLQILTDVLVGQHLVLVHTVRVLAESIASHTTPPLFGLTLGTAGMCLGISREKSACHELDGCYVSSAARVAQTAVDDALHGERAPADGAADAVAAIHAVPVVQRDGLERLAVRRRKQEHVAIHGLAEGLARVVVHPADLVHVLGREARFGDSVFLEHHGDGLREAGIDVHVLMAIDVGRHVANESDETLDLRERKAKRTTCARNSVITSSTHMISSRSAAINPSLPRNCAIPSQTTIREGMLDGFDIATPSERLKCNPMHKPTLLAFSTADTAESPFTYSITIDSVKRQP